MGNIILLIALFLSFLQVIAQSESDTIHTVKKTISTHFMQNGKVLTPKQLMEITKSNESAYKEMQIAKKNYNSSNIFGFTGGFLIGYPIGTAVAGGDPNWVLAGLGVGLVAIGVSFSSSYTKHAKNAVRIYNEKLVQPDIKDVKLDMGMTTNGLGVRLSF